MSADARDLVVERLEEFRFDALLRRVERRDAEVAALESEHPLLPSLLLGQQPVEERLRRLVLQLLEPERVKHLDEARDLAHLRRQDGPERRHVGHAHPPTACLSRVGGELLHDEIVLAAQVGALLDEFDQRRRRHVAPLHEAEHVADECFAELQQRRLVGPRGTEQLAHPFDDLGVLVVVELEAGAATSCTRQNDVPFGCAGGHGSRV
eukprot:515456-Prymnesium_polylepis.2